VRNIYLTWQMMCAAALSYASSGMSVVIVTLAIMAWNQWASSRSPLEFEQQKESVYVESSNNA
jgi:hypothetical protein